MGAKFTVGAFGTIFDEKGKVLLCHRTDYDVWNAPGGGVESGETAEEAVVREIKEETGLDAQVIKLVGVYTKQDRDDIVFSFHCKTIGGKLTLNNEADRIEYFDSDKLPPNMSENQTERIMDVIADMRFCFKKQRGRSSAEMSGKQ